MDWNDEADQPCLKENHFVTEPVEHINEPPPLGSDSSFGNPHNNLTKVVENEQGVCGESKPVSENDAGKANGTITSSSNGTVTRLEDTDSKALTKEEEKDYGPRLTVDQHRLHDYK